MGICGILTEQIFRESQSRSANFEDDLENGMDYDDYYDEYRSMDEEEKREDKWADEDKALADFTMAAALMSLRK